MHRSALTWACHDLPLATQVGTVQGLLEGGAGTGAHWCGATGFLEALLRRPLTGVLDQLITVQRQGFDVVAREYHLVLLVTSRELAFCEFKAIINAGLSSGDIELPFEVWAVVFQGLAQADAFGSAIDGFLVDPDAVVVFRFVACASAQQCSSQGQGERLAHGGVLSGAKRGRARRPAARGITRGPGWRPFQLASHVAVQQRRWRRVLGKAARSICP
ncbi:hypothetical protein D3C78_864420 [compost metagenome]